MKFFQRNNVKDELIRFIKPLVNSLNSISKTKWYLKQRNWRSKNKKISISFWLVYENKFGVSFIISKLNIGYTVMKIFSCDFLFSKISISYSKEGHRYLDD